jgi:hypothetical protein
MTFPVIIPQAIMATNTVMGTPRIQDGLEGVPGRREECADPIR